MHYFADPKHRDVVEDDDFDLAEIQRKMESDEDWEKVDL